MKTALMDIGAFLALAGVVGLLAHVLGEALPRRAFDHEKFPYKAYAWEREGAIYNRAAIQRWKNKLPDKSRFVKSTVEKSFRGDHSADHVERLLQETCVAEFVHWALLALSPLFLLVLSSPLGIFLTVLYGLSNIPFIMIQRYNRPRLARMYARLVSGGQGAPVKKPDAMGRGGVSHAAIDTL